MPLTMNTSAIVDGQSIDAGDVLTPFNNVKAFVDGLETLILANATTSSDAVAAEAVARAAADTAIVDGVQPINQLNFGGLGTTLVINMDAIAITKSRHVIDTQGGASTDDLSTITGFVVGDMLFIQTTSAARVVTIKHGVNNIFIFTLADIVLDHPSKIACFLYDQVTGKWCSTGNAQSVLSIREELVNTPVSTPLLSVPDRSLVLTGYGSPRLDYVPSPTTSNTVIVRASGATIQAQGAVITTTGTPSASNQAESSYSSILSAATIAAGAGWLTSTYDLLQRRYNPAMEITIRTPPTFPTARWFIGFFAALPTNVDDPVTAMIGLRYSTVAGDTGWKIAMDDGTTLTLHGADLAPYTPDTPYLFRIRVDGSGGGVAYFSVNNGAEIAVNTGMVGAAVNLGFGDIAFTNVALARNTLFRSCITTWA